MNYLNYIFCKIYCIFYENIVSFTVSKPNSIGRIFAYKKKRKISMCIYNLNELSTCVDFCKGGRPYTLIKFAKHQDP